MKKEEKIIKVEEKKRIQIYKEWNGKGWLWYVEPQIEITWLFFIKRWGASDWGSDKWLINIKGFCSLKEAEEYAERLKNHYLEI